MSAFLTLIVHTDGENEGTDEVLVGPRPEQIKHIPHGESQAMLHEAFLAQINVKGHKCAVGNVAQCSKHWQELSMQKKVGAWKHVFSIHVYFHIGIAFKT